LSTSTLIVLLFGTKLVHNPLFFAPEFWRSSHPNWLRNGRDTAEKLFCNLSPIFG